MMHIDDIWESQRIGYKIVEAYVEFVDERVDCIPNHMLVCCD